MNMEVVTTGSDEVISAPQPLIDTDVPADPASAADEKKTDIPAPGADDKTETPEQQEVKKESRRQRAIRRERDARVAAETENRILREQIAARDTKPAAVEGEPKREDFDDYETYLRAVTKYDAKQEALGTLKARDEANQGKDTQTKQATEQQAIAESWGKREAAVIKATPDYEEAVTPYVEEDLGQLSDGARRLIVDSEVGPQVLHHLATNADVHDRIAKLSPLRQIVELGKLEDSLAPKGGEPEAPKVEGKKVSTAPAPIKPVSGAHSATTGYRESMTPAEYADWKKSLKH